MLIDAVFWGTTSLSVQVVGPSFAASTSTEHHFFENILVLMIYEYMLTIDDERVLVWQQKWTGTTALLVLNRLVMIMTAIWLLIPDTSYT